MHMIPKQKLSIDTDRVEDMELIIHWKLRHQMAFIYEIDTCVVQPLLPRGLFPIEARPSVSLVFIGYNDYQPGNVIGGQAQPNFHEMTRCILVQPDLSIKMPLPRFTFFVHRIGSENQAFVDQEVKLLHLPSYQADGLVASTDEAGSELHLSDARGPIQHLKSTHPAPVYRNDAFFGQYYTVEDGKLYFGVFNWRGVACIHQRAGDAGGIFDHPFLRDVAPPFPAASVGGSYQQVFTRMDEISEQRFYAPRLVREIA